MGEKVNVFQLVEGFGLGGAEKKLLELVQCLDKSKFEVTVCGLGLVNGDLREEFMSSGVRVVELKRNQKWDFGLIFRLAKLMKSLNTEVVMTTLFYADVLGPIAARLAGAKRVYSWETISSPEWLIPHKLWTYKLANAFRTKVISVSSATADFLINDRKISSEKVVIVPYGVDLARFKPGRNEKIRKEFGFDDKTPVVGMVGRLHPQKGHIYLIEAADAVLSKFPNTKFLIVGDGKLRAELKSMVKSRKISDQFVFTGARSDIPEILNAIDIFVLPSLYEGLPNVILEAMAAAKPIVATPADGTKEAIVHGESGILVPLKDSAKLADEIIRLLEKPDICSKLAKNARKRVEQYFSLQDQIRKFEELYSLN